MQSQGNLISRACAGPVVAMGLMFGSVSSGHVPTERDFRLLCWEFHNIRKEFDLDSVEPQAELTEIRAALAAVPVASRLARIGPGRASEVRGLFRRGSFLIGYLDRIHVRISDIARAAAIVRELEMRMPADAFRRGERAFLRTSARLFLRGTIVLLGLGDSDARGEIVPGRVDLAAGEPRPEQPPDVGLDDLLIVAQRLGTPASDYRDWGQQLLALPSPRAATHARLDQFRHRPIVLLDHYDGEDRALSIPSPWNLVSAAMYLIGQEFVEYFAENATALGLRADAPGLFGGAFEGYLERSLSCEPAVRRVPTSASRTPDFAWEGDAYTVLIEAKVRVSPASDPHQESATSLLETWKRLCGAVEQAHEYVPTIPASARRERYVLVIVVHEPNAAGYSGFRHAAARFGLLDCTDLVGVAVWSPAELEQVVLTRSADEAGREIERRFLEAAHDALAQPPDAPTGAEVVTPWVEAAWGALLPEVPLGMAHTVRIE